MANPSGTQQQDLTRTDAIRLWQDSKRAAELASGQRDDALRDCTTLRERIKVLEKDLATQRQVTKDAEAKINAAEGRVRIAEKVVEGLEQTLLRRRDCTVENKKLTQRNGDLKRVNDELTQKVAQLRNHDFKADNEALRGRLNAEVAGRAEDAVLAEEKDTGRRVTIGEQADTIAGLRKDVKDLTEKLTKFTREELAAARDIERQVT